MITIKVWILTVMMAAGNNFGPITFNDPPRYFPTKNDCMRQAEVYEQGFNKVERGRHYGFITCTEQVIMVPAKGE